LATLANALASCIVADPTGTPLRVLLLSRQHRVQDPRLLVGQVVHIVLAVSEIEKKFKWQRFYSLSQPASLWLARLKLGLLQAWQLVHFVTIDLMQNALIIPQKSCVFSKLSISERLNWVSTVNLRKLISSFVARQKRKPSFLLRRAATMETKLKV
jgi:hypothetical protein